MSESPTTAALQAALAAENAAVYGYGVLGAHLTDARRKRADDAWDAHRTRRDDLRSLIRKRGAKPAAAAPAYRLPFRVTSADDAARLAATLENEVVAGYLGLAGVSEATLRRYAALAMQEATARALRWDHSAASAFPGMPKSALRPEDDD